MEYARTDLKAELEAAHPELRAVLKEMDTWCVAQGMRQLCLTSLHRSPERNKAVGGVPNSLHLSDCAADVDVERYRPTQVEALLAKLHRRCPRPLWEVLAHDVGSGLHIHVGVKDRGWREREKATPPTA